MQLNECLFRDENNRCSNIGTKEHIIQEGLGGTLSSKRIICNKCNGFFSQELDKHLVKFYEPIVRTLAPFLSGGQKHKKKKTRFISDEGDPDGLKLEYNGGVANLGEIKCFYAPNGRLEKIIAPPSVSKEQLEKIAKSKGETGGTFEEIPLTEHFPNAAEKIPFNITPVLIRAILLDILELAHHVFMANDLPNIAKHECLRNLRSWIRTGIASKEFSPSDIRFCFAPISDLLDSLFEPSTFSHRIVISYNHKLKGIVLVAQFVNTMPWVFILENLVMDFPSGSIVYKKALLGGSDQLEYASTPVLDIKSIKWRKFSTATPNACKFAKQKFMQEFQNQHARAHYESDMRNDEHIKQKLIFYSKTCLGMNSPSIYAIVKLMENRYEGSPSIKNILEITERKALEEWKNSGNQPNQQVLLYRDCLKHIKNEYGYPIVVREYN